MQRCDSVPSSSLFLDGVPRYAAVNESVELVRRSRLERAVPFTNAVLRRLADEGRTCVEALPEATLEGRGAAALLPRLGRRNVVARPRSRGGAGADAGPERGAADRRSPRAGRDRRSSRRRRTGSVARRSHGRPDVRGGSGLAAERRLSARRALRRLAGRGAGARPVRCAGRQGVDDGRGRRRRRGERVTRPRARGERAPPRRDERPRRLRRRPRSPGRPDRLRSRARRRPVLRARRACGAAGSALALPAAARAAARAAPGSRRPGATGWNDRLLRLHRQQGRVRGRRRRGGSRDRPDARRGVAAVPAPDETRVPPDAAARPRDERLLRRPPPHP